MVACCNGSCDTAGVPPATRPVRILDGDYDALRTLAAIERRTPAEQVHEALAEYAAMRADELRAELSARGLPGNALAALGVEPGAAEDAATGPATAPYEPAGEPANFLAVTVGGEAYAIDLDRSGGLLPRTTARRVGSSVAIVCVRGRLVPVYDSAPLLGHGPQPEEFQVALVRLRSGAQVGIAVDAVTGVTPGTRYPSPPAASAYIEAIGTIDGALAPVIDVDGLVAAAVAAA